ncbi:calcium-binding protein [Microvirga roseola]|uniref:hypothetical protein n=1 Tax=Microvirga roseola TaxID=2883126 RepID=UPI001E32AE01|nr:hypothetical protein [Microvirga roseola]
MKYRNSADDQSYSAERDIVVSLQTKEGAKIEATVDLTVPTGKTITFLDKYDENIVGSEGNDVFVLNALDGGDLTNFDTVDGRGGYDVLNVNTSIANLTGIRNIEQVNGVAGLEHFDIAVEEFRSLQVIDLKDVGSFTIHGSEIDLRNKSLQGVSEIGVYSFENGGSCTVTVDSGTVATMLSGNSYNDKVILTQGRLSAEMRAKMYSNGIEDIDTPVAFADKIGTSTKDTLKGSRGDNVLSGGAGSDTLLGKGGRDFFLFDADLGKKNVDVIKDFKRKFDKIMLDRDVFLALEKDGKLTKASFHQGSKAHDKTDRIIYDNKTGALYYDEDGRGGDAAVKFATLWNKPKALSHHDFFIA